MVSRNKVHMQGRCRVVAAVETVAKTVSEGMDQPSPRASTGTPSWAEELNELP